MLDRDHREAASRIEWKLEGIVSKRLGSRYVSGRSRDWLKLKNPEAPGGASRGRRGLGTVMSDARKHAKVENFDLFGATVRMGPPGLWFYADSYLSAAKALHSPTERFDPAWR